MTVKPAFWTGEHASAFDDAEVARLYRFRPAYPPETFDVLAGLLVVAILSAPLLVTTPPDLQVDAAGARYLKQEGGLESKPS